MIGIKDRKSGYRFASDDYDLRQIIQVREGVLCLHEHGAVKRIHPGETLVLFPHTRFALSCPDGYRGFFVIMPRSGKSIAMKRSMILFREDILDSMGRYLFSELIAPRPHEAVMISAMADLFCRFVYVRCAPQHAQRGNAALVRFAKEIIRDAATEAVGLRVLLGRIPVSYEHFERIFRRTTGMRPKEYRDSVRISTAKRLLAKRDMPITDIAFECGYSSSQHFSADFRKHTGKTPAEFGCR